MKFKIRHYVEITIGVVLLVIGYYFFFLPSTLVVGGMMGISILIDDFLPFSPSIFLYITNGTLLIVGGLLLGKDFFYKTAYATLLSPTIVFIFEHLFEPDFFTKEITQGDFLISCIVGSLLSAVGLGICFKNHGTTGGMDVIQKIISKFFHMPFSKTMWITDFVIIVIAGVTLKPFSYNIERVTFGFIAILLMGYVIDYIALNAKSRRTAYIITSKPKALKELIYKTVDRGVTECDVRGGYTGEEKIMLICTLDKNESYKLNDYIKEVDDKAFIFVTTTKEVHGNYER